MSPEEDLVRRLGSRFSVGLGAKWLERRFADVAPRNNTNTIQIWKE